MVPEEMRGVWQRRSIAVDGGSPIETAYVLWLQAGEAFADLRVPHTRDDRVEAFAGATAWDPPRLTWHHTLDWNGGFSDYDCGDIEWREGAMVERGTFDDAGATRAYEEVWDRVDPGDQYVALTAEAAIIVQVGSYSMAMRDRRARGSAFDVRAGRWSAEIGWREIYAFGAGRELPFADVATEQPAWAVIESTPAPAPR